MNLLPCIYRRPAGPNGSRFFCDHPRLTTADGLVTAEVCTGCALRTATRPAEQARSIVHEAWELVSGCRTGRSWQIEIKPGPRRVHECDVVIPYRTELKWVPQALDSILSQRYVTCRIHLVNDDSPEDDRWLRRMYARFANVLWYRNRTNLGPYRSVHQVWQYMSTPFLAVQDSDDVSLPNRLWLAIETLELSGGEVFAGTAEQFLDPSVPTVDQQNIDYAERRPYHHSAEHWKTCPRGYLMNPTVVMRRSLFERMNGYHDMTSGGDIEFCTRLGYAGARIAITNSPVVLRRVHSGSLSRSGKYRVGGQEQRAYTARLIRQYREYEEPDFNPARYGCLNRADRTATEVREGALPFLPFVLASKARTGSHLLMTSLNRHPEVRCHGELFNEFRHAEQMQRYETAEAYLLDQVYDPAEPTSAVGFKLQYEQGRSFCDTRDFLRRIGAKVLITHRRNLLRRFISLQIAERTQVWYAEREVQLADPVTLNIDPDALLENFEATRVAYEENLAEFAGCELLLIYYEDLCARYDEMIRAAFQFLGVTPIQTKPYCIKQQRLPLEQVIENYEQVSRALVGTRWEWFLNDDPPLDLSTRRVGVPLNHG